MLQERKTESIYREIVISKMRLKRRFASYHIADIFFTWLYIEVRILITVVFLSTQAMAEKIERMELVSESKDKVCFIKSFALFFPSFSMHKNQSNYFVVSCNQQFLEIQELYNSQLHLTADLSEKLDKTEVAIFRRSRFRPSPFHFSAPTSKI
jgi:hypothetical protein